MRRKIVVTLLAAALLPLAACSSNSADGHPKAAGTSAGNKTIELITNNLGEEYWAASAKAVKTQAKKLGYTVKVTSHNGENKKESELVDAAIATKPAAVLLDPANADGSIGAVRKLVKAEIPVFIVNAEINQEGLAKAQLISDNAQGAALGAQRFAKVLGGKGTYVQLNGPSSDNNAVARANGYKSVLSQYPGLKNLQTQSIAWDTAVGRNTTQSMLQAHPDVDAVLASGDGFAVGAASALEQAGKAGKIKVGGFDGSPDAVKAVKAGHMSYTVLQPVVWFSAKAVVEADRFLKTGKTGVDTEKQLFNCKLITPENVDKYIAPYTLVN
ncbi:D-ribose ABC transporter substrate-binding protein [Streptomyces inhibens]|uniref:D-ribose ABC transporter substrate-binding protein n=1 Tax=Streptomyces inhibens TaxID=2293571 RepID=UPI001EE77CF2|nr:D-ribose ABC transporter substrate-binding protein [Streptomyces inhibens]UKY54175.1 D-ribose ABC transporter substrate-binding protein [Streptomyces inhibens]